jgi:hypothetical protein
MNTEQTEQRPVQICPYCHKVIGEWNRGKFIVERKSGHTRLEINIDDSFEVTCHNSACNHKLTLKSS